MGGSWFDSNLVQPKPDHDLWGNLDVHRNVTDPYHFDTDPDPGSEKIRQGSESWPNFDTYRIQAKKIPVRIRIQGKKDQPCEFDFKNAQIPGFVCLF